MGGGETARRIARMPDVTNVMNERVRKAQFSAAVSGTPGFGRGGDTSILFFRRNGTVVEMDFCVVASQTAVYLRG